MEKSRFMLVIQKVASGFITLFIVMSMLFFLMYKIPGDDVVSRMFPFVDQEMRSSIVRHWRLDGPLTYQYLTYLGRIFTLNLNPAPGVEENAFDIVLFLSRFTLLLFTPAVVLSYLLGIVGFGSGKGVWRKWSAYLAIVRIVPIFVLTLILKSLFVFHFHIFPPVSIDIIQRFPSSSWNLYHEGGGGLMSETEICRLLPQMVLPLIILVVVGAVRVFSVLQSRSTAGPLVRVKGGLISEKSSHLLTLLDDAPFHLVYMLSGGLLIEYIFQWPGVGYVLFETLKMLNYPILWASVFCLTLIVIVTVVAVELVRMYLVKRIFVHEKEDINKKEASTKKGIKFKSAPQLIPGLEQFIFNRKGLMGLCMVGGAVFPAVCAPILVFHDPFSGFAADDYIHHSPCAEYPLGTDVLGRDVYSQLVWGFRHAMAIAVPAGVLIGLIGMVVGVVGSLRLDIVISWGVTTFLVWPQIPLATFIIYDVGGYQCKSAVILAVSLVLWPVAARAVWTEVMAMKAETYGMQINSLSFISRILQVTFLYMMVGAASAVVLEAAVAFLGIGNPGVVSWGQMLSLTMIGRVGSAGWWTIVFPGVALTYTVLSFFLIARAWKEVTNLQSL